MSVVSAVDLGAGTTAAGLIFGLIGVILAWRADRRLAALRNGFSEFVRTLAAQLTSDEAGLPGFSGGVNEPSRPVLAVPLRIPMQASADESARSDPGAVSHASRRRAYVGAVDVTNEGQYDFLIQSVSNGEARLSIVGMRNQEPVALSAALRNNTGVNFLVEDVDEDGKVELCTVDRAKDGTLALAVYRWNGQEFVRIDSSPLMRTDDVGRFQGVPAWATQA